VTPAKSRSTKASPASGQKQKSKPKAGVSEGSPASGRKRKMKAEVSIKFDMFATMLTHLLEGLAEKCNTKEQERKSG
jgi:hypothetical protein